MTYRSFLGHKYHHEPLKYYHRDLGSTCNKASNRRLNTDQNAHIANKKDKEHLNCWRLINYFADKQIKEKQKNLEMGVLILQPLSKHNTKRKRIHKKQWGWNAGILILFHKKRALWKLALMSEFQHKKVVLTSKRSGRQK